MNLATLPDLIGYQDLAYHGLTRYSLDQLVKDGEYERVAAGLFIRSGITDDTTAAWVAISLKKPEATVCLLSALALHEMTDEIPTRSNIALPRREQPMKLLHAPVQWHHFAEETFEIGRTEYPLFGDFSIGLYSPERTIIDLFRLRHSWGSDLAISALKEWLGKRGSSPAKLAEMSRSFPIARPALLNTLEILL